MKKNNLFFLFAVVIFSMSTFRLNAQNKSLLFNGTDNKVVIPNHSDFDFTTEFTLEAWIYANKWKDQAWQGSVIDKDIEISGIQGGYMIRIGAGGRMEGIVTPGWQGASTGAVMQAQKWNHVAMVFKDGEMWLYVNGSLEAYKGGLPSPINTSSADLQIGESPGFPGRVWDGMIDEVRIWNIARTASEIQQNMSATLTGTESGLVAYYDFDEDNTSNILTDKTSNGHNGSLVSYGSNYTWVSGYELGQNDLTLSKIVSPGNGPVWSNAERVAVEIKNTAFNSVSNFDVSFEIGDDVYTETVSTTIDPWQTYVHTFDKFVDLESKTNATITAYISWEDDTEPSNNTLIQTFEKSNKVRLMDRIQHNFSDKGQTHNASITLPDDISKYNQLLLHITLSCPSTGCDPWDQMGNVKIIKDDKTYEIARFMTPYGKGCGPWTVDVSDFRSILTGNIDLLTYIQVWGASGWLLTLDLEYVEGELNEPFTKIVPLYELDGLVYGDPSISYDLPEQTVTIPSNAQLAHIRMTNTGHGQANTDNAAEFMEANHHMWVNGSDMFTHHLWKDDCNQNTCSPQYGTWEYARAGWCPGQQVIPAWFNITDAITPGSDMTFDYVLQDYTNLLNSGYNGGSHTEPFYRIYSYLILSSNSPFEDFVDLAVDNVNIVDGATAGTKKVTFELINKGNLDVENAEIGYVINNSDATVETVTINLAAGVTVSHEIELTNFDGSQPGILVVFADVENDIVTSNNFKGFGFGGYTAVENDLVESKMEIYPNPVKDVFTVKSPESKMACITIYDTNGRQLYQNTFNKEIQIDANEIDASGVLIVKLETETNTFFKKIIIE